jgi:hypothetical protein
MKKTLYLWALRYFLVQAIFCTTWIVFAPINETREVQNFKLLSLCVTIVLGIVATILYNREKRKEFLT